MARSMRVSATGFLTSVSIAAIAAMTAGQPALAAEKTVEEITVTARKRSETLQSVPIAITAISGLKLKENGFQDLSKIERSTTNLFFQGADESKPVIFLRGIGTRGYDAGSDPSVGVYIDGVYMSRFASMDPALADVERVEVLKGPQGTLYGRNTIGGAISVVTKDPSETFIGHLTGQYGFSATNGDNLYSIAGDAAGPIGKGDVTYRVGVSHNYRDGYQIIQGQNYRGGQEDNWQYSAKLKWAASENFKIRISGDYADKNSPPLILVPYQLAPGATSLPGALAPGGTAPPKVTDPYNFSLDEKNVFQTNRSGGGSVRADWTTSFADITSITAYRRSSVDERMDLDGTPIHFQGYTDRERSNQLSEELRATHDGQSITWLGGLYYGRESVDRIEGIELYSGSLLGFLGSTIAPNKPFNWAYDLNLKSESLAAFGQVQWKLTDRFKATLGTRFSKDSKTANITFSNTLGAFIVTPFSVNLPRSWYSFDPSLSLSYDLTPDIMLYASGSTGYKSGAFQFIATSPAAASKVAAPERVKSYEGGIKSSLLDKKLRLNATAFYYDYSNLQQLRVTAGPGGTSILTIDNAASSTIKGLEIEGAAVLSDNWSMEFGYAYLDATFDKYIYNATLDFSGNQLQRSPKNSLNFGPRFTAQTGLGMLDARVGVAYRSSFYWEADNERVDPHAKEGGYALVDASISLARGPWVASIWGANLTDKRYRTHMLNSTGNAQRASWAAPRTTGIRLTYTFE